MIKSFTPQPYDGLSALPDYVTSPRFYTLVGYAPGDYTVTLARMTVGDSKSAGNPLAHVLFESFDDHGVAMKTARTRAGGLDREYIAACEAMLRSLGDWFMAHNPELSSVEVMSQTCH